MIGVLRLRRVAQLARERYLCAGSLNYRTPFFDYVLRPTLAIMMAAFAFAFAFALALAFAIR